MRTDLILLLGTALGFAHALIFPQVVTSWKTLNAREIQSMLLSVGAWAMLACYGVVKMPFEAWTALSTVVVMVALHALAMRMKWDIFRGVTPLFSMALIVMAQPFSNDTTVSLYAVYVVLLGYAAWLTLREKEAPLAALPLLCGGLGLLWQLTLETHGSIPLLVLPLALCLTPLCKSRLWFSVMVCYAGTSFFYYLHDPSDQLLTYVVPVLWYAALAYRARVLSKPSRAATMIIATLVTITMSWKVSEWVGLNGEGHELTILWAIMAAFCFGMGFVIRERVMRLLMLLLLLASMGKILISVWQLGTLMRIASFLVTGVIFLLLGYVYNKYPEWFGKSEETPPDSPPAS
jgi:predicted membrane protein